MNRKGIKATWLYKANCILVCTYIAAMVVGLTFTVINVATRWQAPMGLAIALILYGITGTALMTLFERARRNNDNL